MTRRVQTPGRAFAVSILAAVCATLVSLTDAGASGEKDRAGEVRVVGSCGATATSKLKLKSRDGSIELEFEVDSDRVGMLWRVALVHERRVAWKGAARTSGPSGSFSVDRRLPDLLGPDTVTARASGPAGITCRATATLPTT
jgi:hypothetical protein